MKDFSEYSQFTEEHPLKIHSERLPVFIAPLSLFTDDTSGNKSKKLNKFDYWSLILASLPKEGRSFHNILFLMCSNRL